MTDTDARLDWRQAAVRDPQPCVRCTRPALLRHPKTGEPCHKVCSDAREVRAVSAR